MPQDGLKLRIILLSRPALSTGVLAAVYLSSRYGDRERWGGLSREDSWREAEARVFETARTSRVKGVLLLLMLLLMLLTANNIDGG